MGRIELRAVPAPADVSGGTIGVSRARLHIPTSTAGRVREPATYRLWIHVALRRPTSASVASETEVPAIVFSTNLLRSAVCVAPARLAGITRTKIGAVRGRRITGRITRRI